MPMPENQQSPESKPRPQGQEKTAQWQRQKDRKTLKKRRDLLQVVGLEQWARTVEARVTQGTGQKGWPVGKVGMKVLGQARNLSTSMCSLPGGGLCGLLGLQQWSCCVPTLQELSCREWKCVGTQCLEGKGR